MASSWKSAAFVVIAAFLSSDFLPKVSCFSISSLTLSQSATTTTSRTPSPTRKRNNHHHRQQLLYSSSPTSFLTTRLWSSSSSSSTDNAETITTRIESDDSMDSAAAPSNIFNTTLSFPPYEKLMALQPGEFVTSEPFTVNNEYDFCVKLYPRGGGHKAQFSVFQNDKKNDNDKKRQGKSGFGMSYEQRPLFGQKVDEKVGAYLQYLPRNADESSSVAATFSLRLKGQQTQGPKFDVEWKAGMRFVALDKSNLAQGQANDFGAHLLQTQLLPEFLGLSSDDGDDSFGRPVTMQVQVQIHDEAPLQEESAAVTINGDRTVKETDRSSNGGSSLSSLLGLKDVRSNSNDNDSDNDDDLVRVGRIVVPVLQRLSQRPKMFRQGVYPGVEYRILRILNSTTDQDLFYYPKDSAKDIDYELKPIYPLVPQLERQWPVRVKDADIPKLLTSNQYNLLSAIGSLLTAVTGLLTAFVISQAVSLFFIPSRSMDPTLQVGDVLLVDKVTPRLASLVSGGANAGLGTGDVVLFHPPTKLLDIVQQSGGRIANRDLFVKRIAAQPGDSWTVTKSGDVQINGQLAADMTGIRRDLCTAEPLRLIERYIQVQKYVVVEPNQVFVLGDCESVSVDSRVWGPLSNQNIVGRPLLRLWPLSRVGSIGTPTDAPTIHASEAMNAPPSTATTTMNADWTD